MTARPGLGLVVALACGVLFVARPGARAVGQERELLLARGQEIFLDNGCLACHAVRGNGGSSGPDLSRVGSKYDDAALVTWLRDPARGPLAEHADRFRQMTAGQVQQLALYLASLR